MYVSLTTTILPQYPCYRGTEEIQCFRVDCLELDTVIVIICVTCNILLEKKCVVKVVQL